MTGHRVADDSPPAGHLSEPAPAPAAETGRAPDADERRHAEEALREANWRLEFHTNNSPLAVVEWDANFCVSRWSAGAERLFGWPAEEMVGRTVRDVRLVHEEDLPLVEQNTARMADGTAPRNVTRNRNYTRDGRVLHCEWYNSALIDERTGRLISVHSEVLDVTARVRAETLAAQLHATTAALARSLSRAQVADVIVTHMLAALGAAAASVLEMTPDGREYMHVHSVGFPDDLVGAFARFPADVPLPAGDVTRTRSPVFVGSRTEWGARYALSPRSPEHRAWAALPLLIEDRLLGCITLSFPAARDFAPADREFMVALANQCAQAFERSRLYEAEREARLAAERATEQLREAREASEAARREAEATSRAKSEFLAVMSHELRTPLNAIAGYVELIEMGVHGPVTDGQRDDLARVRRNQRHLLGLIEALLTFAKLEAGQTQYDMGVVPVDETLRVVEELIAPQLRAKALRYEYRRCDPVLAVRADREKMLQIVLNLVANAQKFTDPGGSITLSAGPAADSRTAVVRVRDTGCGIAVQDLERIFEPFVQAGGASSSLTRRDSSGTGLGLAISREFARAMGGDLTVDSEPGKGSTFMLVLPKS